MDLNLLKMFSFQVRQMKTVQFLIVMMEKNAYLHRQTLCFNYFRDWAVCQDLQCVCQEVLFLVLKVSLKFICTPTACSKSFAIRASRSKARNINSLQWPLSVIYTNSHCRGATETSTAAKARSRIATRTVTTKAALWASAGTVFAEKIWRNHS